LDRLCPKITPDTSMGFLGHLISVEYHSELHIAIRFHREYYSLPQIM
jgi:hypothetical protein